jgi:hypothetical protein
MTLSESQRVGTSQYRTRSHATVTRQVTSLYRKETVRMTSRSHDNIIGDLCYDEDFFDPRQLAHLEALNKTYLQRLTSAQQELARIDPPQWTESTETLQSSSSEEATD